MELFFKRLSLRKESLSRLENQVLEYMIDHPEEVVKSTIEELSKKLFASTATISRTCKHLGYSGYQELRIVLTQHIGRQPAPIVVSSNDPEALAKNNERVWREINDTLAQLSHFNISAAINLIQHSSTIEFFGVGASYTSCVDAARKLTFSGKPANARADWDELRAVAHSLTPKDLAIIVSYSGETLHIMEYATILSTNQVPILAITGNIENSLANCSQLVCPVTIETVYLDTLDLSSRLPLNLALEHIIHGYILDKHAL